MLVDTWLVTDSNMASRFLKDFFCETANALYTDSSLSGGRGVHLQLMYL